MLRGGGGGPALVAGTAPVIAFDSAVPQIEWEWEASDPDFWSFQNSVDGVTEWEPYDTTPGSSRSFGVPADSFYYRMQGVDGFSNPTTPWSNVVQATD